MDIIVTDGKGNLVTGLTAGDFRVSENGVQQQVLSFEPPRPGATLTARSAADAPTVAIETGNGPMRSMRLITLVIDLAGMRGASLKTSLDASIRYVDKAIGAEDYVAVYSVGSSLQLVIPFSRDKQKITEALQSLGRGNQGISTAHDRERTLSEMSSLSQQVQTLSSGDAASKALAQMAETERLTLQVEMTMQATLQTRVLFRALRAIAQASGNLPGRKNVVLFSEGLPATSETYAGIASVVDAANRSNVAFYVIDPSGLGGTDMMGSFDAGSVGNGRQGSNTRAARDGANAGRGTQVVAGESKFDTLFNNMSADGNRDGLRDVADRTGGLMIKNRNELNSSLERIDRDLREFYTLTYQPQNSNYDGSFRKISVEVPGRHTVRYRKGYYAMAPGEEIRVTPATAQLLASVANGSLKATIKPKLNATIVFNSPTDFAAPVSIWLPGDLSWVTKNDKGYAAGITMVVTARSADGHIVDIFQKYVDVHLSKDEWKGIEKKGLQLISNLTIPKLQPLDVEAVVQFSNGAVAVGDCKLGIADTSGARLTSLFLTPRLDVSEGVRDGDPPALHIAKYQLAFPTEQQFTAADKLTVYFGMDGVSMDTASGSPRINIALALKSGDRVVRQLPANALFPWPQSTTRIFLLDQFVLAGHAPGNYSVNATLKDLASKTTTVQAVDFSIH
jgi:VWFA-related protein